MLWFCDPLLQWHMLIHYDTNIHKSCCLSIVLGKKLPKYCWLWLWLCHMAGYSPWRGTPADGLRWWQVLAICASCHCFKYDNTRQNRSLIRHLSFAMNRLVSIWTCYNPISGAISTNMRPHSTFFRLLCRVLCGQMHYTDQSTDSTAAAQAKQVGSWWSANLPSLVATHLWSYFVCQFQCTWMIVFRSRHTFDLWKRCIKPVNHGSPTQVGKHSVLANPSSKGPREFIVLSEMQAWRKHSRSEKLCHSWEFARIYTIQWCKHVTNMCIRTKTGKWFQQFFFNLPRWDDHSRTDIFEVERWLLPRCIQNTWWS